MNIPSRLFVSINILDRIIVLHRLFSFLGLLPEELRQCAGIVLFELGDIDDFATGNLLALLIADQEFIILVKVEILSHAVLVVLEKETFVITAVFLIDSTLTVF